MIKFKYELSAPVRDAISSNISGAVGQYLIGYMEEGVAGQLRNMAFFVVCENDYTENSGLRMSDALGIVAKNESEAIAIYGEVTGCDNATVFTKLVDRCDKLEVEPA